MLVSPERDFVPPTVRVFIDAVTTQAESGWAIRPGPPALSGDRSTERVAEGDRR